MNPYQQFISDLVRLNAEGKALPLGGLPPRNNNPLSPDAPVALIFSPHPDDECIIGGYALRLMREAGMRIVNVAVTLGSNQERRAARREELKKACAWIGFDLEETGLEKIVPATRAYELRFWSEAVKTVAETILRHRPAVIFFPHERDWNRTHIGTHFLVMDALKTMPADFAITLVETEFWGQMPCPNLVVELSAETVADLMAALSFHIGEMKRNPYHLRFPAWLQDNVRRGAEVVGGQGGPSPEFVFATLYRARKWENKCIREIFPGGKLISVRDEPLAILQADCASRPTG